MGQTAQVEFINTCMSLQEEHRAAVWCCSHWQEERQSESPEPRLADICAGSLDAHCSRGVATERKICRRLWIRHEWKKPAPPQGIFHMEREPKISKKYLLSVAVMKGRFSFLDLTLNISFPFSIHQLQCFQPCGTIPVHK